MSNHAIVASLATALLVTAGSAQTRYIPDNDATMGGCNVIPFGTSAPSATWSNQRYQTMATFADLGSPTGPIQICNIGFASCRTGDNISHHDTIVIKLGQTNATSLSTTFATNLAANVVTVLKCKDFNWHQKGATWERIGLQRNYTFIPQLGRNLIIDICVTGNRKLLGGTTGFHTGSRERLYKYSWTGTTCPTTGTVSGTAALKWCVDINSWSLTHQGVGCQGLGLRLGGSAQLGQAVSIITSGAATGAACFIAIGGATLNPGFDLGVVGAKGCIVYCVPLVTIPGPNFKGRIPNDRSLICSHFCIQAYCLHGSYPGTIATSNLGILTPGIAR